jgi:hypothetical protein
VEIRHCLPEHFPILKMSLSLFPTQHEPEMGLCFQWSISLKMSTVTERAMQEFLFFVLMDKYLFP